MALHELLKSLLGQNNNHFHGVAHRETPKGARAYRAKRESRQSHAWLLGGGKNVTA